MTATVSATTDGAQGWGPLRWALLAAGLRLFLLAAWLITHQGDWAHFISLSDAGSFLQLARCIAGLDTPASLTYYDTRVMAGWPLLISPGLWLLPAIVWLPVLTGFMTGLAVWLFHRLCTSGPLTF